MIKAFGGVDYTESDISEQHKSITHQVYYC